jgi:replication factor A1
LLLQFRKLAELETTEAGTIVDVIGVLDTVEPWAVINKKDGTETRKRSLTIRDDSGRSVEVSGVGSGAGACFPCVLPRPFQHHRHS